MKLFTFSSLSSMVLLGALSSLAYAQCPTTLSPPWAFHAQVQGTASSVPGGYDSSACRLRVALNQNASPSAKAMVVDQSPANETRYRGQFILDASALNLVASNRSAIVFSVLGASNPVGGTSNMMQIFLRGNGSSSALRILVGDTTVPAYSQVVDVPLPNPSGANRVEFDMTVGAGNGQFRYWVSPVSSQTNENAPSGSLSGLNNTAWTGVDQVVLGLAGAGTFWRQAYGNTNYLYLDQFTSRRTGFIGTL